MKFKGTTQDLETIIGAMGRTIVSSVDKGNMHQIKTEEGETINLFENETLQIQGKSGLREKFQSDFEQYHGRPQSSHSPTADSNGEISPLALEKQKQVFIVHGHDDTSREQLELVLHKLGLEPYVLANTGGHGLTIIEALEQRIGFNSNATSFGIVLMTPDDMGYAKSEGPDSILPRARQNVVLEMGMLISSIGRKNMAIIIKGHLEKPSDADGILYIPFDKHVKEAVPRLANRLKDSGFVLSPDKITHASS